MKATLVALLGIFITSQPGGPTGTQMAIPRGKDIPSNLRPYVVALLVRGPRAKAVVDGGDDLQARHLAYLHRQIDAGKYALAGPFTDNTNARGIIVLNTTKEEARRLVDEDPLIKAGVLAAELHSALLPELGTVAKY